MPDAWDDDWIAKADTSTSKPQATPSAAKISKAERRAKQAEFNRQLWQDAEDPQDNFFLKTRDVVPLKSEFKPAMQVLSRKPASRAAPSIDPATGLAQLSVEDEDEDEDDATKNTLTMQERQEKAQREREEKQRKYEEVRQKLFGTEEASTSSKAGSTSPAKNNGSSRNQSRNKAPRDSRPSSSASNRTPGARQLYDPHDSGKPGTSSIQKKETKGTPNEIQPIRNPRNPDDSGRGGFGFAPRGGRAT
ncbi:hypothetical protein N7G274_003817 [Stereocaulon virgatum]|uniref:SUZ domain-containing protein n=1 Tax=Stereocaulon virgatum TaxID=373712 RepID=A0ABR4ADD1_9LECA